MAFIPVKKRETGHSLIELMMAASLGLIALMVVSSLFLSIQRVVLQRSEALMLVQQVSSAMLQLKEDIQRAGYNTISLDSIHLIDASELLFVSAHRIGYVYQLASGDKLRFSNTVYQLNGTELEYCNRKEIVILSTKQITSECYDLFDPQQIKIVRFDVTKATVANEFNRRHFITISIKALLKKDPLISHSVILKVKLRNN